MRDPRPPRRRPDSRTARPAGAKRHPVRTVTRKAESSRATPSVLRDLRRDALAIFQRAVERVDPERAVMEDLHLDDLRTATVELLSSGIAIRDVNEVRKGLYKVKGGRLSERASARGATVVSLIMSDIVGNPIDDIGSGPTALHSSRGERAKSILERHRLWDSMPATVQRVLRSAAEAHGVRSSL